MIRVNLLSGRVNAAAAEAISPTLEGMSVTEIQRQGVIRVFFLVLVPIILFIYEAQSLPQKKAQISELTTQIAELRAYNQKTDASVREIKNFQEDEKKIKKQIAIVEVLSKTRLREIKVLDLIQQVIPEKVWLKSLEFSNNRIKIKGQAATDSDVTNFSDSLSRSVYLNDVQPAGNRESLFEGFRTQEFEISASLEKVE